LSENKYFLFLKNIFYFFLSFSGLFLLTNKYPYFLIGTLVLLVLIGLIFFIFKRSITSSHSELLFLLLIIFAYFIFSYFLSGQSSLNFISYDFLKNDGNFFFCYILFFVLGIPFIDYHKAAKYYLNVLFISFSVVATAGGIEYFLGGFRFLTQRSSGVIMFHALNIAHNATGSVYTVVCIAALVFFLKETRKKLKILYLLCLVLCLTGLLLTKSRSCLIGFLLAALFVIWLYYKSWKKFLIFLGASTFFSGIVLFLTGTYKRFLIMFNSGGTNFFRLDLWKRAWEFFQDSPFFGIGFGRFNDIYNWDYNIDNIYRLRGINGLISFYMDPHYLYNTSHAHNSYLQLLAETGILGLFLLMLFWVICFIILYRSYRRTKDNYNGKVYLSCLGIIVSLFVMSFSENYFSATTVMACVSVIVSLGIGLSWQESRSVIAVHKVVEE
jgi:O-antigen ligase